MTLHLRRFVFALVALAAAWIFGAGSSRAQLLPPGDFNGKSFGQWGLNYAQWADATALGVPSFPDTVNGVRFLPIAIFPVTELTANVTVQPGTALFGAPFILFGERYDDGTEDDPVALASLIDTFFAETTLRTTLDGMVVLEGTASSFTDRTFGVSVFPQPIPYNQPQPRGENLNAVASLWTKGIGTMFAPLSPGQHTLRFEFNTILGDDPFSTTLHITIVPEPSSIMVLGAAVVAGLGTYRSSRRRRS
jgi:hypothetical protein